MHPNWSEKLAEFMESEPVLKIFRQVVEDEKKHAVFPPVADRFAFLREDPKNVRVVIIGQDPYINAGQAHGYCFSVRLGVLPPPSLLNIYKEVEASGQGTCDRRVGDLTQWVKQGVFLINAHLSVRGGEPGSHMAFGWELVTDRIIRELQDICHGQPLVFMLWGAQAKKKRALIVESENVLVLETSHPSPLGVYRGFAGSGCFSKCNEFLAQGGVDKVDWSIS